MQLVRRGSEHLESYVAALERGWSADDERGLDAICEELSRIHADAAAFLAPPPTSLRSFRLLPSSRVEILFYALRLACSFTALLGGSPG